MLVSEAVRSRKTIRAFDARPVAPHIVREILELALRAPSGGNLQPWRVYVLSGAARDELVRRVHAGMADTPLGDTPEYHIYPPGLTQPYEGRRVRVGKQLYTAVGVPRGDKAAMLVQLNRNFEFFGAPVGLIFTMDRQMQQGQWADLGMLMQTIMLLARERGLHTCPQEAWARWHRVIRDYLEVPTHEMIFCGLGIGYADEGAPANSFVSERAPLDEIATFRDRP
jgi:nitroreductase